MRKYIEEEVHVKHLGYGSVVIDSEEGCHRFTDKKCAVDFAMICEKTGVNYRVLFTAECKKLN